MDRIITVQQEGIRDMWEFDRSRHLDYLTCRRKRFYGYHYRGQGIQKKTKTLPLIFGGAFHEGMENVLRGEGVESGVVRAKLFLSNVFEAKSVETDLTGEAEVYGMEEQAAIVEGLVRAWDISQRERFLRDFEVIEVEKEGKAWLSDNVRLLFRPDALVRERMSGDLYVVSWKTTSMAGKWSIDQAQVDMQSISEVWGVMNDQESWNRKRKQTENISNVRVSGDGIQNPVLDMAKTQEQSGVRTVEKKGIQGSYGPSSVVSNHQSSGTNQGSNVGSSMSQSGMREAESFGAGSAQGELSEGNSNEIHGRANIRNSASTVIRGSIQDADDQVWNQQTSDLGGDEGKPKTIEGVLYIFSVKGQRKMDDWLGFKTQRTPLAYAWKKLNGMDDEWAWKWNYVDEDTGKAATLGKGWKLVPVWKEYPGGVKAWVEALGRNEIRPRHVDALQEIFPQSLPVVRREDEVEDWKVQTEHMESGVMLDVAAMERVAKGLGEGSPTYKLELQRRFPKTTKACFDFNSKCQFFDICHNPTVAKDPMASGLYQIRVSNHPEDEED